MCFYIKIKHSTAQVIKHIKTTFKYDISYKYLEGMLTKREVEIDHSTIYRWGQYYAPKILAKLRCYWKITLGYSWRVNETYIKAKR